MLITAKNTISYDCRKKNYNVLFENIIELHYQSDCYHFYTCICTTIKAKIILEPITNIIGKRNIDRVQVVSICDRQGRIQDF